MFSIVFLFWRKTESAGGDWFNTELRQPFMDYGTAGGKFKMPQKAGSGGKVQWLATKPVFRAPRALKCPATNIGPLSQSVPAKRKLKNEDGSSDNGSLKS
ncbi:MAG: hypothetical protein KIC91_08890 [Sutterella sp.]|nr:hypothetical protein [Sutterella sp.]